VARSDYPAPVIVVDHDCCCFYSLLQELIVICQEVGRLLTVSRKLRGFVVY
jgi:hypothetical protein